MIDDLDFQPLISAKLLQVNVSINPIGILKGTCSYDINMLWDNGISLVLQVDSKWSVESIQKAIGLKLERFGESMPNHATMKIIWFFENNYCCDFNLMGQIQWLKS